MPERLESAMPIFAHRRLAMAHDFCDFEFVIRHADGEDVSAYVLGKNPYRARAFRSAIETAHGPIAKEKPLSEAFATVREEIVTAARQKVIAFDGEVDDPMPVTAADLCHWAPTGQCAPKPATRPILKARLKTYEPRIG
jgi:hypothetical protein